MVPGKFVGDILAFNKKKEYTEFQKMLYYDEKAKKQFNQNEIATKNYKRNWWKHFYYLARGNGMDHQAAYKDATLAMVEDFPVTEKLILSDFDYKKFMKMNKK